MPKKKISNLIKRKDRPGLWARLTYTDELGRRRVIQRKVASRTEGEILLKKLRREIEDHGEQIIDGDRLTFTQLAKRYEERKLIAPVYKDENKVAGLRSHESLKRRLKTLVAHFGARRVKLITHSDVEKFKLHRLATKNKRRPDRELSIASVNRELQLLRAVLNYAKREGWITRNPFETGAPLVSLAHEVKRERLLSREEEARLLAACAGPRAHLRPLLVCALDTGMRRGEMFQLRWADVDLGGGLISVRAFTTKTMKSRTIGLTERLRAELERLWEASPKNPLGSVFGVGDVKKSFAKACALAGVENFRLHDCRHVATTRMIQSGMPPMEVMKITGHSQMTTFLRYLNTDGQAAKRAAAALDGWHATSDIALHSELVN
jgi:integrase